ncbi:DUF4468 domain-containing protein [Hymenobacter sp. GOD-10R]|uniref:DUF4468 domain-containing protein n=1 Tax=Hymenobacter sp. GOD-10R TaxID=3093922 RepID=UPI002D7A403C|nr:DUF4468 domain-containing protein [Hymenobacter sp. GOD-10R]WRQ27085.1 DUF4468 domain-containing protein [Hymenobacter sp. GOD-10R]
MKTLLAIALFLLTLHATQAQTLAGLPLDSATHKITYTSVVQVPNATKEELYARAREWAVRRFQTTKDPLQLTDAPDHSLVVKGFAPIDKPILRNVWFTLILSTKDGRYRYVLSDLQDRLVFNPTKASIIGYTEEEYTKPKALEETLSMKGMYNRKGEPNQYIKTLSDATGEAVAKIIASLQQAETTTGKDW